MSSTNRSEARNTHISDYYVTPIDCIRDFFHAWLDDMQEIEDFLSVGHQVNEMLFLDPCAGGDAKHPMSYAKFIEEELGGDVTTVDIREDSLAGVKADFLTCPLPEYDIVITNPPFNIAQQIIEKALEVVQDEGYVIMLLRLNFFGSKARKPFWEKQLPVHAYVHHRRMSFTDDGKTDSIEYMHAVWQKGNYPKHTKLRII